MYELQAALQLLVDLVSGTSDHEYGFLLLDCLIRQGDEACLQWLNTPFLYTSSIVILHLSWCLITSCNKATCAILGMRLIDSILMSRHKCVQN